MGQLIWTKHRWENGVDLSTGSGFLIRQHILDEKNLSGEEKRILLNYPVVYIHSWRSDRGEPRFYVGETIDLLRRTEEHTRQIDRGQRDWHQEWGRARDRVSYYFSGLCMNKSLALDLEDCLLRAYPVVYLRLWAGGEEGYGLTQEKPTAWRSARGSTSTQRLGQANRNTDSNIFEAEN